MEARNGPVNILLVNGNAMDRGGIEAFLMNYYRHMDRTKIHCDFIVHGYSKGIFNEEIEQLGGKIYHVPTKSRHPFKYQRELKKIFGSGNYQIVHSHLDAMSCWVLKIAKACGIPVRIAHSHNTKHLTNNRLKLFINEYARKHITQYATHYFACSDKAGRWLFGDAWGRENSQIINNAIDFSLYQFNREMSLQLRKLHGVEHNFVIGHVGRFSYQKNHMFLLEVYAELRKVRDDIRLVLIGDGEDRIEIEKKISQLGMDEAVLLLGSKSNVYDYYSMMDLFVLPSRFEGLPVVAVEAQVNGLTCFLSDRITREICITEHTALIGIENVQNWVTAIRDYIQSYDGAGRNQEFSEMMSPYHIEAAAKKLEGLYLNYILNTRGNLDGESKYCYTGL